ncbi:MAG: FAD-dependent oxidoreductase, partial [Planctomycetales bacterium]|nr:FAD-dependent oxidoreductase [Planctomycetales bacterium]
SATTTEQAHYYQIVISALQPLNSLAGQSLAQELHRDLAHVFPLIRDARLLQLKKVTDPQAVFRPAPGQACIRAPAQVTPWLFLAGDWTDTDWPSTMEGAILSGFRAAETLLGEWGKFVKIVRSSAK